MAFGTAVRALRVQRQVAQDAFALAAGIDRSYFGKLERGERQLSLGIMLRVAGALGVSAAELVAATEKALPQEARALAYRKLPHGPSTGRTNPPSSCR